MKASIPMMKGGLRLRSLVSFVLRLAGIFCLACWLFPFLLYRIVNVGTLAMLLLGLALAALPHLWWGPLANIPWLRRLIGAGGGVFLVFCLVISALMAYRAWFSPPPGEGDLTVIVLGSKVNGDQPSLMLRRRLDIAADYLRRHPQSRCVVTGGQGADEEYPEAHVMRWYLLDAGIDADRILLEDQSSNTRQNLQYARPMLGEESQVVIVTDSFHQLRASVYAGAEGLRSYNLSSLTPWGLMPSYWLREILGVSWAFVLIRLEL